MKRCHYLGLVFAIVGLLACGLAISAPPPSGSSDPRPGSVEEHAGVELRRIERLVADPKTDPEKLWQELVDFRRNYPGQPQALRVAELMAKVRSPLDALDRKQVPEEDRMPWMPSEVVAVLGDSRGRHWGTVSQVAVTPDGKWIVSSGGGGTCVWDAATLNMRAFLAENILALSDDCKTAITRGPDDHLCLYDLAEGKFKERLRFQGNGFPERKNKDDEKYDRRWKTKTSPPKAIRFTADGKALVVEEAADALRMWDLTRTPPRQTALVDSKPLGTNLRLIGTRFIWAGSLQLNPVRRITQLWEWKNGKYVERGTPPACEPLSVTSHDGCLLVLDRRLVPKLLEVWDMTASPPKAIKTLERTRLGPSKVAFSPDDTVLAMMTGEGALELWPLEDKRRKDLDLRKDDTHSSFQLPFVVSCLCFTPDMKMLVLGCQNGSVRLWDIAKGTERLPRKEYAFENIVFTSDGKRLLTGAGQELRLWDLTGAKPKEGAVIRVPTGSIGLLALAPDNQTLAVCNSWSRRSPDGKEDALRLYKLEGNGLKETSQLPLGPFSVSSLAFSPDGQRLLAAGMKAVDEPEDSAAPRSCVRFWDITRQTLQERGDVLLTAPSSQSRYASVIAYYGVWASNGQVVGCTDAKRVWLLRLQHDGWKQEVVPSRDKRGSFSDLAFMPDAKVLLTVGHEWFDEDDDFPMRGSLSFIPVDGTGGKAARALHSNNYSEFTSAAITPDGSKVATMGDTRNLVIWDTRSGTQFAEWKLPGYARVIVAPDGRHVATSNSNGTIYIHRLPLDSGKNGK